MKVIGYDLATNWCGYGILEGIEENLTHITSGTFQLKSRAGAKSWKDTEDIIKMLDYLVTHADNLISIHNPDAVGVEVSFGRDKYLSMFFARISTAIIVEAMRHQKVPHLIHPTTLKKVVTGNGRAEKADIVTSLSAKFNLIPARKKSGKLQDGEEDRFDALGVAFTILRKEEGRVVST